MDTPKPALAQPDAPRASDVSVVRWLVVVGAACVLLWRVFALSEGAKASTEDRLRLFAQLGVAVDLAVGAVVVCLLWTIRDAVHRLAGPARAEAPTP